MLSFITEPWPWYISGPLLGLMVPILLLTSNKAFGVSSSFRHICAAVLPFKPKYLKYEWKKSIWSLVMMLGVVCGAVIAVLFLDGNETPKLSSAAVKMFTSWGVTINSLQPAEVFAVSSILTLPALVSLIVGGFLIGFGTRYANGCTSGHAIMGLSLLNPGSLAATISFFAGGILVSNFIVPLLF